MNGRTSNKDINLATSDGITELEELVQDRVGGHLRDFQLVIVDRGLLLRGRTPTYYAKQLAQHAVMLETDLPIVANEIEVS